MSHASIPKRLSLPKIPYSAAIASSRSWDSNCSSPARSVLLNRAYLPMERFWFKATHGRIQNGSRNDDCRHSAWLGPTDAGNGRRDSHPCEWPLEALWRRRGRLRRRSGSSLGRDLWPDWTRRGRKNYLFPNYRRRHGTDLRNGGSVR